MQELANIIPTKQSSFYRYFHPYFTKLPPNVASKYISYFTKKGDTVLDPFCGSGVVGMESLLLGRSSISSDLSPLAVFITRELLNDKVSASQMVTEFENIKKSISKEINLIWSYGNEGLYTGHNKYFEKLKQEYWYPQCKLSYRSNIQTIEDLYDIRQLLTYSILFDRITEIENESIKNSFLIAFFGAMSRANLTYMLSGTRGGSVLHNGGSSLFSIYDYRKPINVVVIPVWERFERRVADIIKIKTETTNRFFKIESEIIKNSRVLKLDVLELNKKVKDESIDYILTDPPYGGKIPYLELASMWSAWMRWDISKSDLKKEIIEGGELSKNQSSYVDLMGKSIEKMSNSLKEKGSLSIVYQHNNIEVWSSLLDFARKNNLEFSSSFIQPTNCSTVIKKKFKGDIISAPLVINFKKKSSLSRIKAKELSSFEITKLISKELRGININSDEEVYNVLARFMSASCTFSQINLVEQVFNSIANKKGRKEIFRFSKHSSKK